MQEGSYSASICSIFLMKSLPSSSNCLMQCHREEKAPFNTIHLIPQLLLVFLDAVVALMLLQLDAFN